MKFLILSLVIMGLFGCSSVAQRTSKVAFVDQSAKDSFEVDVTVCRARGSSKKSIVILPPTGGTNPIDKSNKTRFCLDGYDVYLMNDWSRPGETGDDLGFHQRAYSNYLRAMTLVMERIETPFIGLLGTSVGATYAAVAANRFPRLNAIFFIVGGVPLMEVVVESDHPSMKHFKETRRKRYGFKNDDEYLAALKPEFQLDPTDHPNLGRDVGVVIATEDTTVPTKTQEQLVAYFQPRKVIQMKSGHFWTIVKTWMFHTAEIVQFFDESAARLANKK